jgi:hypothetical protein
LDHSHCRYESVQMPQGRIVMKRTTGIGIAQPRSTQNPPSGWAQRLAIFRRLTGRLLKRHLDRHDWTALLLRGLLLANKLIMKQTISRTAGVLQQCAAPGQARFHDGKSPRHEKIEDGLHVQRQCRKCSFTLIKRFMIR